MKRMIIASMLTLALANCAIAGSTKESKIKLRNTDTGVTTDSFEAKNGTKIKIGDEVFIVMLTKKTESQLKLEKKLKKLIIPSLNFSETPIWEAVETVKKEASSRNKDIRKTNIIVAREYKKTKTSPKISMSLKNASLHDTLLYLAEAADLNMRIDDNAVVISK